MNLKFTVKTSIEQSDGKKKRKVFEFEIEDTIVDSEKVIIDFIKKTKDIMRITVNENKLRLFARKDFILKMGRDLAYLLGFTTIQNGVNMKLQLQKNKTFKARYKLQPIPLLPTHLFLYSNIVKPSLVGEGLHRLLKVIPVYYKQNKSYHTYEFEHSEFIPISTTEVQYIEFELRSYSGTLIEFADPNVNTFLNLTFQK